MIISSSRKIGCARRNNNLNYCKARVRIDHNRYSIVYVHEKESSTPCAKEPLTFLLLKINIYEVLPPN